MAWAVPVGISHTIHVVMPNKERASSGNARSQGKDFTGVSGNLGQKISRETAIFPKMTENAHMVETGRKGRLSGPCHQGSVCNPFIGPESKR